MTLDAIIPEIWVNEIALNLEKFLVYAQAGIVNRDYEGEITGAGDTVHITGIGPVTVSDYTKNRDISAAETLTDAQATLLIDQQKYFNFQVDDIDKAQQKPKVLAKISERAAYGMNDAIDQYVASLYTDAAAANLIGTDGSPKVPNNTALDASNVYNLVVDCATALTDSKCPTVGRWMIVPPWFYGRLLKEPLFVDVSKAGTALGLRNGMVGAAAGFQILQSHNVPNTSATKYKIMFGISDAITYANALVELKAYSPELRFAEAIKGLNVFGAKVVYPDLVGVLTCNKT